MKRLSTIRLVPLFFSLACCALLLSAIPAIPAAPAADPDPLDRWIAQQTALTTWSADFTQIRRLKSLQHPLRTPGKVWFQAPDRFRWELGDPARTVAIRQPDQLTVLYPRLQRAEIYPLSQDASGPWRDALTLLEAGFPRTRTDLEAQFRVSEPRIQEGIAEVELVPKSARAAQLIPSITVRFDPATGKLAATAIEFADGSTMENIFTNAVANPSLSSDLFTPSLPPDYKIEDFR